MDLVEWVTLTKAATCAGVSERTIRRWVTGGKVQALSVRVDGRVHRRVRLLDVLHAERDTRITAGRLTSSSAMSDTHT